MQGRAPHHWMAAVVGVMLALVGAGGHLPECHLPGRVLPHPGVTGDGALVVGDHQDPHLPL